MNPRLFHYCSNKMAEKALKMGLSISVFSKKRWATLALKRLASAVRFPSLATTF